MRYKETTTALPITATLALVSASMLCLAMVGVRIHYTGESFYDFMVWNLFLAWIPLCLAAVAHRAAHAGHRLETLALSVLWLLFFPNAPYLLSDFVHLGEAHHVPLWCDGLMLTAFAGTGLALGLLSLDLVRFAWMEVAGRTLSWVGVVAAVGLSSVGIFLGRFFRFNSWDAILHPYRIGRALLRTLGRPDAVRFSTVGLTALTVSLLAAYAVFCGIARARVERVREVRSIRAS